LSKLTLLKSKLLSAKVSKWYRRNRANTREKNHRSSQTQTIGIFSGLLKTRGS